MLSKLLVKNYTLISQLELDLYKGFNVITGETGAGKSIMMGALKLVLGERADMKVLFDPNAKCVVEAHFEIEGYRLKTFFDENDLDYSAQTILRREILPSGKSRAFVNDTPVTLVVLKEIGGALVNVHSQHETNSFKSSGFQFDLVDAYAGVIDKRLAYKVNYNDYKKLQKELDDLIELESKSKLDLDYFSFQLNELVELSLNPGELSQLEEELAILEKSDEINQTLSSASNELSEGGGMVEKLHHLVKQFQEIQEVGGTYAELFQRINSIYLELEDLSGDVGQLSGTIELDPERLNYISERVNSINGLLQKHQLHSEEELVELRETLEQKVGSAESIEGRIIEKRKEVEESLSELMAEAEKLHENRSKSVGQLSLDIEALLKELSMVDSKIRFELEKKEEPDLYGYTALSIYFRTNKGAPEELVHKSASGGELARLMLTLKSILAKKKSLPTIIFDEIDTGVSGEVASKIGSIMRSMGANLQVIAITHLPQVAGKGEHHYSVYKTTEGDRTLSHVRKIEGEERVLQIAKMLSGDTMVQSALDTAKQLMIHAN